MSSSALTIRSCSVNHPNIAQIYGLEELNQTRCIVMELLEGDTLQERLKRGPKSHQNWRQLQC